VSLLTRHTQLPRLLTSPSLRHYSDTTTPSTNPKTPKSADKPSSEETKPKKKTQAELDQELLAKLQGHEDDGGAAGIEYEDGKPVSMKRSVKNNMFRYI
jgi:hypothetical protein